MNYWNEIRRSVPLGQSSWMEGASGFLIGCGIGLFAGACAAMLLAPDSGMETRRKLASKARDLANRARPALEEAKEQARTAISNVGAQTTYGRDVPIG